VVKRAADSELLSAIRSVHRGRTVLDPALAVQVVERGIVQHQVSSETRGPLRLLSQREREVLELVVRGHTNQQVADRLGLSVKTVETHRARLVEKLGLRSRADLVRYALDAGLFDGR
jgi:DNA-binding NarL/FixJ family response regulator